jgi:hypothetical protein
MTTRAVTFPHQTRLAVSVIIEDDTGTLAFSILLITALFRFFGRTGRCISGVYREGAALVRDIKVALSFTGKVLAIGFDALAYGLGVQL